MVGSGQFDRIRIRPKSPDPSGSGSATLVMPIKYLNTGKNNDFSQQQYISSVFAVKKYNENMFKKPILLGGGEGICLP